MTTVKWIDCCLLNVYERRVTCLSIWKSPLKNPKAQCFGMALMSIASGRVFDMAETVRLVLEFSKKQLTRGDRYSISSTFNSLRSGVIETTYDGSAILLVADAKRVYKRTCEWSGCELVCDHGG